MAHVTSWVCWLGASLAKRSLSQRSVLHQCINGTVAASLLRVVVVNVVLRAAVAPLCVASVH
jgi:hypothetical protein